MRIAILSDSHDHVLHLNRAVGFANTLGAELLIHCGDLISPFMLNQLLDFSGEVHLIYGNNIGDCKSITERCNLDGNNLHHHGASGEVTVDGIEIGFSHYPDTARKMAESGKYDIVCYGHNHIRSVETVNTCLLINPGDLLGKEVSPGFLILDTENKLIQHVIVGSAMDMAEKFSPVCNQITLPAQFFATANGCSQSVPG